MQQYYTDIEEIRKNSFLYVEYGAYEYTKRIAFYSFCIFIMIYLTIGIPCDIYQIVTGTPISPESIFSFFAAKKSSRFLQIHTLIAAPSVPMLLVLYPALIRSILLIGDVYFCRDAVYVKRIFFLGKIKILAYEGIGIQYQTRYKTILLVCNLGTIKNTYKYKEISSSYRKFLFVWKHFFSSFFLLKIVKEKDIHHVFPHYYDMNRVIEVFKAHGMDVDVGNLELSKLIANIKPKRREK